MPLDRASIADALHRLNEAENRRPSISVDETILGIDAFMAANVEGWKNGEHAPHRDAERESERMLFGMISDYNRRFDQVIIDPPRAAVMWTMTGTFAGIPTEIEGCSTFEFNDDGRIQRYWLFSDTAQYAALLSADN